MWKTLRELQEVQNEVGYDPGQKVRDRIIANTEAQLGYAPGLGMFGVPIVKPRPQEEDLSFLGNKWGNKGRKNLEDLPSLISPRRPLEKIRPLKKLSPLKLQKKKYLEKIEKKLDSE